MKKILVIGGGTYQIPLIQRIVELGYAAYCVDKNPKAPGFAYATEHRIIDVMDKDACLHYAQQIGIDAVMTYGATLTLPTVAYIGKELSLPALPMETAAISVNKYQIKKRLAENGCHIKGSFFVLHSVDEAKDVEFALPCVCKPSDGSGSKGVSFAYNQEDVLPAVQYAFDGARYGEVYVESLVKGEEYSVEAFVANQEIYVYAVVKTTFERQKDGSISYGHRTPSGLPQDQENKIVLEVEKAIRALDITIGSVNFDVILCEEDGNPYIIDCGIRIGQNLIASHMVPFSRGVSELDNTIQLALGQPVDAKPKFRKAIATRLLIYKPGVITEIKPMNDVIGQNGVLAVVMRKGVGDRQNEYREKSDTCGWVVVSGLTPEEAEQKAEKAKSKLEEYIVIGGETKK